MGTANGREGTRMGRRSWDVVFKNVLVDRDLRTPRWDSNRAKRHFFLLRGAFTLRHTQREEIGSLRDIWNSARPQVTIRQRECKTKAALETSAAL